MITALEANVILLRLSAEQHIELKRQAAESGKSLNGLILDKLGFESPFTRVYRGGKRLLPKQKKGKR